MHIFTAIIYFRYSFNFLWFSLRTMYEASSLGLNAVLILLIDELLCPIIVKAKNT